MKPARPPLYLGRLLAASLALAAGARSGSAQVVVDVGAANVSIRVPAGVAASGAASLPSRPMTLPSSDFARGLSFQAGMISFAPGTQPLPVQFQKALQAQVSAGVPRDRAVATQNVMVQALKDPRTLATIEPALGPNAAKKLKSLAAAARNERAQELNLYVAELQNVLAAALEGRDDAFSGLFDGLLRRTNWAAAPAASPVDARGLDGESSAKIRRPLRPSPRASASPFADVGKAGAFHENDPARVVVMHEPGSELISANGHPASALFTDPVDWKGAIAEHARYRKTLEANGIKVYLVRDVLLEGTRGADKKAIPGPKLDSLRTLAAQSLKYDTSALVREFNQLSQRADKLPEGPYKEDVKKKLAEIKMNIRPAAQEDYRQDVLKKLSPESMVDMILNRPTIKLHLYGKQGKDSFYVGFNQVVQIKSVINLYFTRDQQITTQKGVVINNMSFDQRKPETKIMKFVFEKMGVPIVTEVTEGTIDGGDYIPAGDLVFQGQGLRTSEGAIRQLLREDAYGAKEVAVVKDLHDQSMDRMHLDTVFNVLSDDKVMVLDDLFKDPKKKRVVDLYRKIPSGGYVKVEEDQDFEAFLRKRGFQIAAVANDEQLAYATNFLNVGNGHIVTPYGGKRYLDMLRGMGIKADYVPMPNLSNGYGAAHCTTQVIRRDRRGTAK